MKTVAVLLSAYNGENYIAEQLESIFSQSGVAVKLYVRDDGSSDGTRKILESYAEKYPAICVRYGENVGAAQSFMRLLYEAEGADFYAFADQDDIWLKGKLAAAVEMLEQSGKMLYAGNQQVVDGALNLVSLRYAKGFIPETSAEAILQSNLFSGCTMVLTAQFKNLLSEEGKRPSPALLKKRYHDVWVAEAAAIGGGICYDERAFILYRQHGTNAVGADKISGLKLIFYWFKKLGDKSKRNGRSALARELVEKFPQALSYPLIAASTVGGIKGKRLLLKNSKAIRAYSGEGRTSFALKVILGLY